MANQVQYGFVSLQDAFSRRVIEVGVDQVYTAIQLTVDAYNQQLNILLSDLCERTTLHKRLYRTMSAARLQPIDENGRALPIKTGASYTVGWPLRRAAAAWGQGYEAGLRMTVEEANEQTRLMLLADTVWMRDHVLGALLDNASWTFTDELFGDVTILPIANGDAQKYFILGGATDPVTAQHFVAQSAAIDDTHNPFPTAWSTLRQYADNTGPIYALVPSNLIASIEALSTFLPLPDPNIRPGSAQTILLVDPGITTPGILRGYLEERIFIYEWVGMPSNYIILRAQGSPPPLAMREDDIPELQGFRQVSNDADDFPWAELQYRRKAGFGALNRTAAYVIQIGSGSYAVPTGYGHPQP